MPYRLYVLAAPGWSTTPLVFDSADKIIEAALMMLNRDRQDKAEAPDFSGLKSRPFLPVSSPRTTAVPYRFYETAASGVHSSAQSYDCASDIDAMIHAGSLIQDDGSVEIWRGTRFVGEIGQRFSRWGPAQA